MKKSPFKRTLFLLAFIVFMVPAHRANPADGTVAAGEATITGGAGTLTVNQTSARAIINWSDFSIAAGELARFVQPDAASAVLNRVLSGNPSSLLGDLQANGKVYLLNPNGILVGDSARIDTAGFLASTLNVTDTDFLTGDDLLFTGDSTAAITNLGAISASGGDIFLIARRIENSGTLIASDGTVGLAGGSEVLLTTGGDERVFIRTATAPGEVVNAGGIAAATAELKAAGGNAYALAINNTGTVRATGTEMRDGQVWLVAGTKALGDAKHANAGTAANSGSLAATNTDGTGGFVETSGEMIDLSGSVSTGAGGAWLIDPTDVTIDASLATTTTTSLDAGTDVLIEADNNITVSASIAANGSGDLELLSDIDRSGAGTVIFDSGISIANAGSGDVTLFYNPADYTNATDYSANISSGSGEALAFMWVHDVDDLQAMDTNLDGDYALSGDIDASATSGWNAGAGFAPVGDDSSLFTGTLDGLEHVITGLVINRPLEDAVGLFGTIGGGVVRNLGLEGGTVTGQDYVGGLAGGNEFGGTIISSYTTGTVTGNTSVGGLVGYHSASTIARSYATGTVTGDTYVGGLVGYNSSTITQSYAMGAVTGEEGAGGLVGYNDGSITQSYATGAVAGGSYVGGLVGWNDDTITSSYWDKEITGQTTSDGSTPDHGLTTADLQSGTLPAGFDNTVWVAEAGSYLRLVWQQVPESVQTLAGTVTGADAGIDLTLWVNGVSAATTTTTSGGAFSFDLDPDLAAGTTALVFATGGDAAVGNRLVPLVDGGTSDVAVAASMVWMTSAATNLTSLISDMGTTAGALSDAGLLYSVNSGALSLDDGIGFKLDLTAGSFDFNTALGLSDHAVAIDTAGTLNQGSEESMALQADSLLLTGAGSASLDNLYNQVGTLAADIDGALEFINDADLIVGELGEVSGVTAHSASIRTESEWSEDHNLTVANPITVAAGQGIELAALGTLSLESDLILPDSYLTVTAGGTGSAGTIDATGAIEVDRFTLADSDGDSVRWMQVAGDLPAFSAQDFRVGEFADFLRATGGSGTQEDPYLVTDVYGLQGMASDNHRVLHWALVADLDAADTSAWNDGLGFSPIGLGAAYFGGTFDGQGHTISNLTINRDDFNVGLFGFVYGEDALVENVHLVDVDITGGSLYAAGIVGSLDEATVRNVTVSGTVTGSEDALVGGLVGYSTEGTMEDVSSSVTVTGSGEWTNAGGLVGNAWMGSITRARATGAVMGEDYTGGLVGVIEGVDIEDAYATGAVEGRDFVGGLVGEIYDEGSVVRAYASGSVVGRDLVGGLVGTASAAGAVLVEDAYAVGAVEGRDGVGGLIGNMERFYGSATLRRVYATGTVTGESWVGGLAGALSGGISVGNAFWNTETSGQETSAGSRGQGLTTAQFEDTAGFMELAEWNFEDVWAPSGAGYLPELYSLSAVARVDTTASRVYGDDNPEFAPSLHGGGPSVYVFGPEDDALATPDVDTTADTTSNVGLYAVTGAATVLSEADVNYRLVYTGGFTITPRTLTASLTEDLSKTYDGTLSALLASSDYELSGLVNGDGFSITQTAGGYNSRNVDEANQITAELEAEHLVAADGTLASNYTLPTNASGAASITPATLVYTANGATKTYGAENPDMSGTVTGFVEEETATGATTGTLAFTSAALVTTGVGDYAISGGGLSANHGNYVFTQAEDNATALSIDPASLTVTAANQTKSYGDAVVFDGDEFEAVGLQNDETIGRVNLGSAGSGATVGVADSPYAITVSGAAGGTFDTANYTIAYEDGELTITPRELTITADDASKTYGETTTFAGDEFASDGLQNDEMIGSVSLTSDGAVATAGVTDSPYTITASSATGGTFDAANYTITYENGSLTIAPKEIEVTATGGTTIYGDTPENPGFTAEGLVNEEAVSVLTGLANSFGIGATTNAGDHDLSVTGTLTNANYTITERHDGSWTVTPRALTVTANDASKTYGDLIAFDGDEFASDGLQNDETIGSVSLASDGAVATAGVTDSPYTITASEATGGTFNADNYTITYVNGALTVTPAPLTITAADATRDYGVANPEFSATLAGLVNGETSAVVNGLEFSTDATVTSDTGVYAITPQGATAANYTITFVPGALAIGGNLLTITADSFDMIYGAELPAFTASYAGLLNGDTVDVVSGLQFNTTASLGSGVGTYTITPFGATAANYLLAYRPGTLTIDPRALSITADAANKIYGETVAFGGTEFTSDGLQYGESIGQITLTSDGATPTAAVADSPYVITATGATGGTFDAGNYTITYVNGALMVTPAPLTITSNDATRDFGQPNPDFTATLTGLVNGESSSVVGGLAFATPATTTSPVGDYVITPFGAASPNYMISYVDGTLQVAAGVSIDGNPVEVPTVDGEALIGDTLAVIVLGDRFVLIPLSPGGTSDGTSVDGALNGTLADITSIPRFMIDRNEVGGTSLIVGGSLNVPGFEVVTTLGGEGANGSVTGGAGALSDPDINESGLVRENSISFGNFRVVYQELIDRAKEIAEENIVLSSSFREFLEGESPTMVLLRRAPGSAPAPSDDGEGRNNG